MTTRSIEERARAEFPAAVAADVERALASYGDEPNEPEADRVRAAILDLAAGDASEVAHLLAVAKRDFRDVLVRREAPVPAVDGSPIVPLRYYKWGGHPHWRFDIERLGADVHGRWFGLAGGTTAQRGFEPPITFRLPAVVLVPDGAWWTAMFNVAEHDARVYADITTPATWRDGSPGMVDLDLDVIQRSDGTVFIDDEDEFAEHAVAYEYPGDVVASARAACEELLRMVENGVEPFGTVAAGWLARFLAG